MKQDYTFEDIVNAVIEILNKPKVELARVGAVSVLGAANPVMGVVADVGNTFLSSYNDFKLNCLLSGLASGLKIEKRLNQLYTYVKSSPEKALIVANTFKRTVNAESPKVCILYGLILADHLDDSTTFTIDELIVCRALEEATDFDLENFKIVMEEYLRPRLSEAEKVSKCQVSFPKDFDRETELNTTCDWCVYSRLFTSHALERQGIEDTLNLDENYYATNAAVILLDYIHKARQI
ncbi:MAG: hypothetical protein LUE24_11515 [Lachnospiraceae bacterium]|nr:hypothetical protein [Lachnospiraceae bacterium]